MFFGALVSRSVWMREAPFHPDESTVLWMALDATRGLEIPDHGLVSSYHFFQPPGLVWLTMPFVALGGGRPEGVIIAFALLNASAVALLVSTVARTWGIVYAAVLGALVVVGPDAFISAWIWHPSLYTAVLAIMLSAGIRIQLGSPWWALVLVAAPGLYGLVHYSGVVLLAPALALLLLSNRTLRSLLVPAFSGTALVGLAWLPFLSFQVHRSFIDLEAVVSAANSSTTIGEKLESRLQGFAFALSSVGHAHGGGGFLPYVIATMVMFAVLVALLHKRWSDPGFALPASMLATGIAAQTAVDQASRTDVLMVWLVPTYALAAWSVVQLTSLVRPAIDRRSAAVIVTGTVVFGLSCIGIVDLHNAIRKTAPAQRLGEQWRTARSSSPVRYEAAYDPGRSVNRFYLPCDPPYDWGAEIWYLREILSPGRGRQEAVEGGAFRSRQPPPCPQRP